MADDQTAQDSSGNDVNLSFNQLMQLIKETGSAPQAPVQPSPFQNTAKQAPYPKPSSEYNAQYQPMGVYNGDLRTDKGLQSSGNATGATQQQPPGLPGSQNLAQKFMENLRQQNPTATPQQIWATMKQAKDGGMFATSRGATSAGGGPRTVEEQIYAQALQSGKSPDEAALMAQNYKRSQGIPGANLTPQGNIEMRQGGTDAIKAAAEAKAAGAETGKTQADLPALARGTKDVINTYKLLQNDAAKAPSGAAESALASAANVLNVPTKGSIAQASFDANLNNLFLATIRTLKGTGRVMQSEIQNIQGAAPKPTDSMEVKQAKIEAHMSYYKKRMEDLGFDPDTGKPIGKTESKTAEPAPAAPKTINFADLPE